VTRKEGSQDLNNTENCEEDRDLCLDSKARRRLRISLDTDRPKKETCGNTVRSKNLVI